MRIILGLQEAHDASAALMIDGEVVAAAQEERFSGAKGDYGYPEESVRFCLKFSGIEPSQIDEVVLASHRWNPVLTKIKRNANYSVNDWVKEQQEFWKPTLLKKEKKSLYALFKNREGWRYDSTYPMDHLLVGYMDNREMDEMARIRKETVASKIGVSIERVRTITHEDAHTYYSYFGSPMRGEVVALTSEGIGDYSNGSVSIFNEGKRTEISSTKENHLGHVYKYITLLLGMKPDQHEYKVMGLAPYANEKELEKSYAVFRDILKLDGLNLVYDKKPTDLYFWFRDKLEGHRFDGIAGAVQKFIEVNLTKWVDACYDKTGSNRFVFSGGVAQNIKACKTISELECVREMYVCPAAGDTSISIGACYVAMWEYLREHGLPYSNIKPLASTYLGPSFSQQEVEETLDRARVNERYKIIRNGGPDIVARLLSEGKVIARCCGRMEFGLRALGNRSILADPRRYETVAKINSQIKFRDFWMPFTPTILAEREDDYIVNPKKFKSPFMTMAFDSTPRARVELVAAIHPADYTVRPQILEEKSNPSYYQVIKQFEKMTGVGGVLNTSFNLHGHPIVLGPAEALFTMDNSALDGLLLEDVLILRK